MCSFCHLDQNCGARFDSRSSLVWNRCPKSVYYAAPITLRIRTVTVVIIYMRMKIKNWSVASVESKKSKNIS